MAMNYVDSFIKCDASTIEESTETSGDESSIPSEAQINLSAFWPTVWDEIKKIKNVDAKNQVLPLARIKKIMKLDEDVKMISAEAPLLFAKASEIFIQELTLRAWVHTEDNKRRTLQKNDISMAITKFDQFDFLVDIVPREEIKPVKKENEVKNCEPDHHENYYFQIAQNTLQGSTTPNLQQQQQQQQQPHQKQQQQQQQPNQTIQLQTHQIQQQQAPTVSLSQQSQNLVIANPATNQTQMIINQIQQQQEQPAVQLMQQVVLANGEISHVPIPLTQSQLNIIRMQLQNGSNQPLIIQQTGGHVQLSPVNMFLNTATQNTTTDE